MQTVQLEFGNLLGELGKKHKKKEEEKVVRERASKLEFKRLDELYNKNIHDFYLAESNAQSSQKEDKWEEYIFIIRRRFDWQNRYQKTFVDIKSQELKAVLKEVLDGIEGISLVEDKPTLEPNLLFNYLPELEAYLIEHEASEEPNSKTISHLKLLIDYIQADYGDIQKRLFPMLANAEITFELLWALFLPNSLLFTVDPGSGEDRMIKLDWVELRETPDRGKFYQLDCHYVEFDGKIFGEATCTLEIPEFRGVRKIDQLGVYPIQYHTKEDALKQKLLERGKKFCELKGMHYRMYKGIAYFKKKKGFVKVNINGRVMVDPLTFRRVNPNYRLAPVKDFDAGGSKSRNDEENEFDDFQPDGGLNPENMTEEDLLLCSPTVLGFSFSDKLWVELSVSHISDIEWNTGAFDSLVLPESQKRIVRALVESHSKQSTKKGSGFDDFIKGKGKGLVAVLHGRPGVGKTLTAEGISEFLKKPLYCVGAGELGTDARTLELQLGKILDVAHVWGAVLLLDEADVFLERRSVHDLHRNALVSIFLRLLEYFQGILFLTTNRVETFDEAFQSRIHIALRYSDLDRKAKKQIWSSFLDIVAKDEASGDSANAADTPLREVVTKDELENLSRRELNGRQIKNVVRTAQALAHNKGEKLGMEHLREVLEVTEGFERDLKGTGQLEGKNFWHFWDDGIETVTDI
ncbi:P-loop containing nucleoside triphosphate hydrolase protein [Tirmania nivea]|nr:P-loop containing nucleoside triphosphate hydrolase protein [Tirmania nivea]